MLWKTLKTQPSSKCDKQTFSSRDNGAYFLCTYPFARCVLWRMNNLFSRKKKIFEELFLNQHFLQPKNYRHQYRRFCLHQNNTLVVFMLVCVEIQFLQYHHHQHKGRLGKILRINIWQDSKHCYRIFSLCVGKYLSYIYDLSFFTSLSVASIAFDDLLLNLRRINAFKAKLNSLLDAHVLSNFNVFVCFQAFAVAKKLWFCDRTDTKSVQIL